MEHLPLRILMAKKVARQFIDNISRPQHTLTVYFTNDSDMYQFSNRVKVSKDTQNVMVCEHFDKITFVSSDSNSIKTLSKMASDMGLDYTDM
jgi:hypothetical protein